MLNKSIKNKLQIKENAFEGVTALFFNNLINLHNIYYGNVSRRDSYGL